MSEFRERRLLTFWSMLLVLKRVISTKTRRVQYGYVLDASVAIRSKISFTKELRIAIALLEIPVSGWTCLRTDRARQNEFIPDSEHD
jgi:hypothetical protein